MFTIKRAVELTGVSAGTLRAWEQRYGIGNPGRTDAGYRLYDQRAIDEIVQMQQLINAGWSHPEAAAAVTARRTAGAEEAGPAAGDGPDDLTAQFLSAALALDELRLNAVLDAAFARASFEYVIDHWLMPSLRALGEEWVAGRMDIAGEHFASSAIMRRLGAAFDSTGIQHAAPKVLMGTPAGSFHEMGSLALAAAVRRRGIPAVYLGNNIPASAWLEAVARHRAAGVVISVVMESDVPAAQETADLLARECPGVTIIVGGSAGSRVNGAAMTLTGGIAESAAMLAAAMSGNAQSN